MMTKWDINLIVEEYADTITRICYSYGKNYDDTQDIMQNVFLKLMRADPEFDTKEHEKAWIIRVTINECKDFLKSIFHRHTSLEEVQEIPIGKRRIYPTSGRLSGSSRTNTNLLSTFFITKVIQQWK